MASKRITLKQAAQETGLSEYALKMLQRAGKLSFIKVGYGRGRIFFDPDKLEKELEALSEQSKNEQATAYAAYEQERHPEFSFTGSLSEGR